LSRAFFTLSSLNSASLVNGLDRNIYLKKGSPFILAGTRRAVSNMNIKV